MENINGQSIRLNSVPQSRLSGVTVTTLGGVSASTYAAYTGNTKSQIDFISGVTDTKLNTSTFAAYSASTGGASTGTTESIRFFAGKSTNSSTITSATVINSWDTATDIDSEYFSFNASTGELTILKAGWYDVHYYISTRVSSGTNRSTADSYLEKFNGSTWSEISYSRGIMYNRQSGYGAAASMNILHQFNANDRIRLVAIRTSGSDTLEAEGNAIGMKVVRSAIGVSQTVNTFQVTGGTIADDNQISTTTTFSSSKIDDQYARKDALINSVTSTYSVVASDAGKIIEASGTFTITLPNSLDAGFQTTIVNVGSGTITLAATTTLQTKDSNTLIASQYGAVSAYHRGSNVWVAFGDLSA